MNEEIILKWMRDFVRNEGFTDATSLAEQFLREHHIQDALDPEFSKSLDAGYKVAQEIRDHELLAVG